MKNKQHKKKYENWHWWYYENDHNDKLKTKLDCKL